MIRSLSRNAAACRNFCPTWPGENSTLFRGRRTPRAEERGRLIQMSRDIDMAQWFKLSRFRKIEDIVVSTAASHELIGRVRLFSIAFPPVLGKKRPRFEAERTAVRRPISFD